jgi:hypothetical protein
VVLSLLAFLSASVGGYFYYSSIKESAFKEAERQAALRAGKIEKICHHFSEKISDRPRPWPV